MSKLGANTFLIQITSGRQKFAKVRVVKVDYSDFPGEIFEKLV